MADLSHVKPGVQSLNEYVVPQDVEGIKLNQNESPLDLPPGIKNRILEKLDKHHWNRYPDINGSSLVRALSRYTGHDAKGILTGNGSNEMIQTVFLTYCNTGDRVLVVSPGFSIYPRMAQILGCKTIDVSLGPGFRFDLKDILNASANVRMIVIASPNNPTGTALDMRSVKKLAGTFPGIFVLDEAYFEFYGKTAQGLLGKHKNLIILRTFSKAMSLAGLRLGYLMAHPQTVSALKKTRLPFSVGTFQQIAGEVMLGEQKYQKKLADLVISERDRLYKDLEKLPDIRPVKSHANFILFESVNIPARTLFEELYKRGVLLRYFDTGVLKDYLRVTVGSPEENRIFIKTLQSLIEE